MVYNCLEMVGWVITQSLNRTVDHRSLLLFRTEWSSERSFCSFFQKSDKKIDCSVSLLKRAIAWSLFLVTLFVALLKRLTKRAINHLKRANEQKKSEIAIPSIYAFYKEQWLFFEKSHCPFLTEWERKMIIIYTLLYSYNWTSVGFVQNRGT